MTSEPDLLSRAEVTALLDRYLLDLDTAELDDAWAGSLFTDDAQVRFPVGAHDGVAGMAEFHRTAMAKFTGTQHLGSHAVVDVDGDEAALRANLVSTQVLPDRSLFTTGTRAEGRAVRSGAGWRLRTLSFHLVWSTGSPPRRA